MVGSPRTGTSILIDTLFAAGYHGFREGNFLPLIRTVDHGITRHFKQFPPLSDKVLVGCIDRDRFRREILEVFKAHVEQLNPRAPWVDKSGNPDMIEAIPVLRELWPSSIFIFSKRRAIENLMSRVKKFPEHTFEYHCRDWARNMAAWRGIRESLGKGAIELDQQEMIQHPQVAAARIADLVNADPEAGGRMQATLMHQRPQQTAEGTASRTLDLIETGWSPRQIEVFMTHCWSEMQAYKYSLSKEYWL